MLQDLAPARRQAVLFATFDREKSAVAMKAMDAINARFGRGTLRNASTTATPAWGARRQNLSPRYTTQAGEMLVANSF